MIANDKLVLWITINLADLQYPLVIHLINVTHKLSNEIQSAFYHKTATINSIIIAKFFHIIYNAIFMLLFVVSQTKGGLLGPILNYFAIVKINSCGILYLHYLVWLKSVSHLAILQSQIQKNVKFSQKLFLFLEHIIKCSACEDLYTEILD